MSKEKPEYGIPCGMRLPQSVADEIRELAELNNRSFANQLRMIFLFGWEMHPLNKKYVKHYKNR